MLPKTAGTRRARGEQAGWLAASSRWKQGRSDAVGRKGGKPVIVPGELQHHPERRGHWDQVMARAWQPDFPAAPSELERRIGTSLHWTSLCHALPDSPTVQTAAAFMQGCEDLRADVDTFADQAFARLDHKVALVRLFFDRFPEASAQLAFRRTLLPNPAALGIPGNKVSKIRSFYLPSKDCCVSTPRKTEVLSIKTTPDIKLALKAIGEREHRSMANTLETLVMDYYARNGLPFPVATDAAGGVDESNNAKGRQ